jgi:hypothetical protein
MSCAKKKVIDKIAADIGDGKVRIYAVIVVDPRSVSDVLDSLKYMEGDVESGVIEQAPVRDLVEALEEL